MVDFLDAEGHSSTSPFLSFLSSFKTFSLQTMVDIIYQRDVPDFDQWDFEHRQVVCKNSDRRPLPS